MTDDYKPPRTLVLTIPLEELKPSLESGGTELKLLVTQYEDGTLTLDQKPNTIGHTIWSPIREGSVEWT